ncbi:hypothetical protein [Sebaldella termitidis]|nr:hypothetical protein [Sebaldella termitidis]
MMRNVTELKEETKECFEYFEKLTEELGGYTKASLIGICLNEFSFSSEEKKIEKIVIYLELFNCIEKYKEIYMYHYNELNEIIENFKVKDFKYFNEKDRKDIEKMISFYKSRIKNMLII